MNSDERELVDRLLEERYKAMDPETAAKAKAEKDLFFDRLLNPRVDEVNAALRALYPDLARDERLGMSVEIADAVADTLRAIVAMNEPLTPAQLKECFLQLLAPTRNHARP